MSGLLPTLGAVLMAVQTASAGGALRVGMDTRSPPWAFVPGLDYSKEDSRKDPAVTEAQLKALTGLDVDVSLALGKRLQTPVRFVPVAWFDLDEALLAGRIDLIVCAWTPSRQTPADIVASEPYAHWGLLTAARVDDGRIKTLGDMGGKIVGHFQSEIVERTLRAVGASQLRVYDMQEKLFADLKAGVVDAALYDSPYVRWRVANDKAFRVVGEPLNRLGYHVAMRKSDADLVARVQGAVKDLVATGESERIQRKWARGQ